MTDDKYKLDDDSSNKERAENDPSGNINLIHPNTDVIQGPVVVFVGPKGSGKTAVLLRLANYLRKNENISMSINDEFRKDLEYESTISKFENAMINIKTNPPRTGGVDFCLVDVRKKTELKCQILEAPGEHYFRPENPTQKQFNNYLDTILFNSNYKKIVVFFFEKNMLKTPELKAHYSNRLNLIINKLNLKKDKVLVLYNKVDKDNELIKDGKVNRREIKKRVYDNPSYSQFKNALQSNKKLKRVPFLPFSSGTFFDIGPDDQSWSLGKDDYPKEFWSSIENTIKKNRWSLF